MKKVELIFRILRESNATEEAGVIALLSERIPDTEIQTCDDFSHLGVACCDSCHRFRPETEMYVEKLSGGGVACICCAVRNALLPGTDQDDTQ